MATIKSTQGNTTSYMVQDDLNDWHERPVYVAQCHSWQLAGWLGLSVTRFRCLPGHRDQQAKAARKQVSEVIRAERKRTARVKMLLARLAVVCQHNPKTGYLVDVQATIDLRVEINQLKDCQEPAYKMFD